MVKIENKIILEALEENYQFYKKCLEKDDIKSLYFTKGFCRALEEIAVKFSDISKKTIIELKEPIIGNISMSLNQTIELDTPSYLRKYGKDFIQKEKKK